MIHKIRAEIERLKAWQPIASPSLDKLCSFLDSLQEEPMKIRKGYKYRCKNDMRNNDTGKISFIGGKIYYAPEDDVLVSEEDGWRCDTSEDSSNFELVEEPKDHHKDHVSDDLEAEIDYLSKRYPEVSFAKLTRIVKHATNWQKFQLLKNAIGSKVIIDSGGYPCVVCVAELYDYDKDIPLAKKGDKVKIVVIKEEE